MTYIAEVTPDKKQFFMASSLEVGTLIGIIAGAGLVTLLNYMFETFPVVFILLSREHSSTLPSLFFTKVRYGSLTITYNVSTSLFGGTTPLIIAWLVNMTKNNMLPAYYLMAACVFGLIVVTMFDKETAGKSLRGSAPVVENSSEVMEVLKHPEEVQNIPSKSLLYSF